MGNEISSDASNNVILKSKKMTNEELKNRIKLGEKYVQIHKNELKSRKGRTQVTYQPKSKTGNSKTSNKSNVASKPLEKKSKSGGKKHTTSSTHRNIKATRTFIIEFLEKKKIQYAKGNNKAYYEKLVIEHRLITKVENEFKLQKKK